VDTPRPSPRTDRTRRIPHPVLIGHAASSQALRDHAAAATREGDRWRVEARGAQGALAATAEAAEALRAERDAAVRSLEVLLRFSLYLSISLFLSLSLSLVCLSVAVHKPTGASSERNVSGRNVLTLNL